jgi:hypothetical protein
MTFRLEVTMNKFRMWNFRLIFILTALCGLWTMDLSAKEIPAKASTLVNDYATRAKIGNLF